MATKKKNPKGLKRAKGNSKTAFVRGLPKDLPAKDAVAKAKEAGIEVSEGYVYKIRSAAKVGSSKGPTTPKANRGPAARTSSAVSKTDFVRSLPPDTSYADAAEKAKGLGIDLSKAYFYVLKSELKKGGRAGVARAPKGKPGPKPRKASAGAQGLRLTSDNTAEQALIDAVHALGTSRALGLIATIEKFERG
jgi:hypothetical protein